MAEVLRRIFERRQLIDYDEYCPLLFDVVVIFEMGHINPEYYLNK
jgi:hypothetical protein